MIIHRLRHALVALLLALMASTAAADDEALNIYVGQGQMPFADDKPDNRGVYGDLMAELCRRLQRQCHYHSVPWKRVQVAVAGDPLADVQPLLHAKAVVKGGELVTDRR